MREFASPYVSVGNNPVIGIDPTGGVCETCPKGKEYDAYRNSTADYAFTDGMVHMNANLIITPVNITFDAGVDQTVVSDFSLGEIRGIAREAGVREIIITSTARDAARQAEAMYNNCVRNVDEQRRTYRAPGQRVVDTYARLSRQGASREQIIQGMTQTILDVGPTNVSRHAADPTVLNVVDISQRTINNHTNFQNAATANPNVRVLNENNVFHLEITQPVRQ